MYFFSAVLVGTGICAGIICRSTMGKPGKAYTKGVPVADRLLDGGGGKSYLIQALLVRFMQTRYLRGVEMHQQQSEIHFYKVGAPTPTISCKSRHTSQDVSHICKTGYWTINCTE